MHLMPTRCHAEGEPFGSTREQFRRKRGGGEKKVATATTESREGKSSGKGAEMGKRLDCL